MVLARYYNFVLHSRAGYSYIMKNMQENARVLAEKLESMGRFELIGPDEEQLPLVAFKLAGDNSTTSSISPGSCRPSVAGRSNCRRTRFPERPGRHDHARSGQGDLQAGEHVDTLASDIEEACGLWPRRAGLCESERKEIVTGPGHWAGTPEPAR